MNRRENGNADSLYREQIGYLFRNSPFYREKLAKVGFADADSAGGLDRIADLPFTTKDELRATRTEQNEIGTHLAVPVERIARIYSTSGTSGTPSFIPLTAEDVRNWVSISMRSYGLSGLGQGTRVITTYNAGPFAAGSALGAFDLLGACHIPMGTGNTERVLLGIRMLRPDAIVATPSYALHLAETASARGLDLPSSSISKVIVAGEPGGGEPAMRQRLQENWGACVTEVMGLGDIAVSLWGECEHQASMHFCGEGLVHPELVDPETGQPIPFAEGARGELVYTHLRQEAAPLLRFRSRDHVEIRIERCACGREGVRMRCIGRTDDMLIVRGVNLFPTAVREVVNEFSPAVTGVILIRPASRGVRQEPPVPVDVEVTRTETPSGLAETIENRLRERLAVRMRVSLVPQGSLPRSEYKARLVQTE